ncbi:MAG: hypothetical protein U0325_36535 [Polyangiales bacterium]
MAREPKADDAPSRELTRADDTDALDAAQRKQMAEALRRCEEVRVEMESALVDFGRWALVNLFDDDAAEALSGGRANPVWRALLARAGGPTLRLSARMLSVALHVAAYDKRIQDESWRGLDVGRKEILLPLGDDKMLRAAAKRVSSLKLTQRATRDLVGSMQAEAGRGKVVRLTAPRLSARVRRMREAIAPKPFLRKVETLGRDLDDDAREALVREVNALREAADSLLEALRVKRKG